MSESEDQQPVESDPYEFTATAEFRYGLFLVLLVIGVLAYGATWVPRLFRSAAPSSEASVAHEPVPAAVPPAHETPAAPPGCRLGVGTGCDWAGLRSPRPACYHGVGLCDWGGLNTAPPGDKVAIQTAPLPPPAPQPTPAPSPQPSQPTQLAPTPSAPVPSAPLPPVPTQSAQPRCHNGTGACDWGGLKSPPTTAQAAPPPSPPSQSSPAQPSAPQPAAPQPPPSQSAAPPTLPCRNGVGNCDTAAIAAPQPGCHYGVGNCGWASRVSIPQATGVGNVPVVPASAARRSAPALVDDCPWRPAGRRVRGAPMRLPPPVCRECFFEGALFTGRVLA